MRGIVFGFAFTICIVAVAAMALLSFNGCGESPGMECEHSGAPTGYTCSQPAGHVEGEYGPPVGEGGYR